MNRVAKILLGIYLAVLFVLFVILAVILLPLHLGIFKFLLSLLIAPVALAVLFSPFFLVWSEENSLSGKWRVIFSVSYLIVWLSAASVFFYKILDTPRPVKDQAFKAEYSEQEAQIQVTNQSDSIFYSCRFLLTSKGDKIVYPYFFTPLVYRDCQSGLATKDFLDCQLSNRLLNRKYVPFTTLNIFDPQSAQKLDLPNFYMSQTIKDEAFTKKFTFDTHSRVAQW